MTREPAKKWLPEITAFAEGKTIQLREGTNNWDDLTYEYVKFDGAEYRVKPEPKLRAWKDSDDILGMRVRRKDNHIIQALISAKDKNNVLIAAHGWIHYETLLTNWEQLDGSFCGVMEVE